MVRTLTLALITLFATSGYSQTTAVTHSVDEVPSFEVAAVRHGTPEGLPFGRRRSPGRIEYLNLRMSDLLSDAYRVQRSQIVGPEWLSSGDSFHSPDRYIITATYSADRLSDIPLMLRRLLIDRFNLRAHTERRLMPGYSLVAISKGDSKLIIAKPDDKSSSYSGTPGHIHGPYMSLSQLADMLTYSMNIIVSDNTHLDGYFNISLDWDPSADAAISNGVTAANDHVPEFSEIHPDKGASIVYALQSTLGLKLVARKIPVEVLVIDHLEKTPLEN